MKNVLKICLVMVLVLCMVLALAACGGEEETTTANNDNGAGNKPSVPDDEKFNGDNKEEENVDPLPEGNSTTDPSKNDIFE